MPAFSGKHYNKIDPKGRVIIPSPFREIISTHYNPKLFVVNDLFDKCLYIYPQEEWLSHVEKVRNLPQMEEEVRLYRRKVIGSAQEVDVDKQGRILIPSAQREDAALDSDVVIVGDIEKFALWDRKEWEAVTDTSRHTRKDVETKLAGYGL